MLRYYRSDPRRRAELVLLLLLLVLAGGFVSLGLYNQEFVSDRAMIYEAVCREMTHNTTEGRQAIVSSAWWPPLPSLLRWPVAALVRTEGCPLASVLIAALFGAATIFLVERTLNRWRFGIWRYPIVLAFALNPFFLRCCVDGTSASSSIFFAVMVASNLADWIARRSLRAIVLFGCGSALLLLSSFPMTVWLAGVYIVFLLDLFSRPAKPAQREGSMILALLPPVYAFAIWLLMNWLVMGDALYMLRALLRPETRPPADAVVVATIATRHLLAAGLSATLAVCFALARNRAGFYLGFAAALPLLVAWWLRQTGCLWDEAPLLLSLFPLATLAVAAGGCVPGDRAPRGRAVAALLPVGLTLVVVLVLEPALPGLRTQGHSYTRALAEREELAPRIARYVRQRAPYPRVFIAGYDSFRLLGGPATSDVFVPALDFNFDKVKSEYPGQTLFLLVHRPTGRNVMESIHWKYGGLFEYGDRSALWDSEWGEWRLFEIVQAPRREP